MAKFLSDGGNQLDETERQPENICSGYSNQSHYKFRTGLHQENIIPHLYMKLLSPAIKLDFVISAIIHMITCHGNRSSKGDKTGSNVCEVGKGFEGEGGEYKWQAPCVEI